MASWITVLDVVTGISEVLLKLSPTPDMINIHRQKSIGEVAELPLITMVVNCHLWTIYAYANDSMFPLFATQLFGEVIGLAYNIVYFRWSSGPRRKQLLKLYSTAFAVWCLVSIFCVLALAGIFGQTKFEVGTMLGYVGVAFSLSMFSSPLGTLKHVVSTKNAVSIPINMCVMILVSTSLWVGTGIADSDYFVAGVNGAGVLLSCVQIVVYYIYKPSRHEEVPLIRQHETKEVSVVVSPAKDEIYNAVFVESPAYKTMSSPLITVAA